jgi:hypothetical protein
MFIETNNEKIFLSFNPHLRLEILGVEKMYYVELREFVDNEPFSRVIESYEITSDSNSDWGESIFGCFIEFFFDFEIVIYKYVDRVGLTRIFTHRFTENGQTILFNLHSKDKNDCKIWAERILEYKRKKSCFISINSFFKEINELSDIKFTDDSEYYKTYNIGRFPKTSLDFRSTDERSEGLVWMGNWKKFWSYQHPRFWGDLSPKEIIDDILGLK